MDMDRVLENLNDYKDANAALEDKITSELKVVLSKIAPEFQRAKKLIASLAASFRSIAGVAWLLSRT